MFNENSLNTDTINGGDIPVTATQGTLVLNWLDIASADIKATNISDTTAVNLSAYDIPQNHGRGFLSYFKRWRTIAMTVYVKWDSESDFISNLDTFRKACYTPEAKLDWKRDGVIRRIKVNCTSNPQVFQHYNNTFLKLEVTFESLEPFWYKLDKQSTTISSKTASFQEEITNEGNAQADVVAYVLFWSTNTTQVKMKINDYEITVDHTFSNNDVLKIDGENKRVYVNETSIDYSGIFPFMGNASNFFTFTINWTFTADVLILNKKNYV